MKLIHGGVVKRLPSLKAMQAFESTARNLSFSKAADELHVTQSAISHQIKSLELFLGKKLIQRTNSSVSLTSDGDTYFSVVTDCFKRMHLITEHLLESVPFQLNIAAQTSIAIEWLAPHLEKFKEENPEVSILLSMYTHNESFNHADYDVIVGTWPVPPNYVTQKIRDEVWYPVCTPTFYESIESITPEVILSHKLISSEKGRDWEIWAQKHKIDLTILNDPQHVSHTLLAAKAALGGNCFALSCDFIVSRMVRNLELIALKEFSYDLPWGHYSVHYRLSKHNRHDVECFIRWITELGSGHY